MRRRQVARLEDMDELGRVRGSGPEAAELAPVLGSKSTLLRELASGSSGGRFTGLQLPRRELERRALRSGPPLPHAEKEVALDRDDRDRLGVLDERDVHAP